VILSQSCDREQGDQIGRIFVLWSLFTLGSFFKSTEVAQILGLLFSRRKSYVLISTKNPWGYILGNFSQTHLVTLNVSYNASVATIYNATSSKTRFK
jgi:hypothetical protein